MAPHSMIPTNYIVLDVETTGFSYRYNRLIEIGAVKVERGKIVKEIQRLVKTVNYVPNAITHLTGITTKMLNDDGNEPEPIFSELRDFIGSEIFVAHNVYFDFNFLNMEFTRYGIPILENSRICTFRTLQKAIPFLPNYRLETVRAHFAIDSPSHRALEDTYVAYEIMKRFGNYARVYDSPVDSEKYLNALFDTV